MNDTAVPPTRYEPPSAALRGLMLAIALAGLILSIVLLVQSLGADLPGCGGGSSCDAVLTSAWSKIGPVPVAAPAVLVYLGIGFMLTRIGPGRPHAVQRAAWGALLLLASIAAIAAAWFIYVQFRHIGQTCIYCMSTHACSLALAAFIFTTAPIGATKVMPDDPDDPMMIAPPRAIGLFSAAALAVAVLVGLQHALPGRTSAVVVDPAAALPPDTSDETYIIVRGETELIVPLRKGDYPMLGSPDARYVLVYLFDYTCPHCRQLHGVLEQALARYGEDQLAVLTLPTPLNASCNEHIEVTEPPHEEACDLARWALRVWKASPQHFAEFDRWLFEPETPRTAAEAEAYARQLLGPTAFAIAASDTRVDDILTVGVDLFGHSIDQQLPRLYLRHLEIRGRPTADALFDYLETNLKLQP